MRSPSAAFIHTLRQKWETSEVCQSPLGGCSATEIEEIKQRQWVNQLPPLYIEFMTQMGRNMGGLEWWIGIELRYPYVLEFKDATFEVLDKPDIFVITHNFDSDCAYYFHTDKDDPIVHYMEYGSPPNCEPVERNEYDEPLSSWLVGMVEGTIEHYEIIKQRDLAKGQGRA